jgi:glycine cleavage system protein P-like pyridoxal-binding family
MLGSEGITDATKYAILNANYMKARLKVIIFYILENKEELTK